MMSTKKLFGDTLLPVSTADYTNTRLIDRRSSNHKSSHSNIYQQTRLFSLINQIQHRQASGVMPSAILPVVMGRKNDEPIRSFERSKTLDVAFAISDDDTYRIPSRLPIRPESPHNHPNLLQRTTNGIEHISTRLPKRSLLPPSHVLRSERVQHQTSQPLVQLIQYQNIQNAPQRYHLAASSSATTNVSMNRVLVHLKYSNGANTDRNCLVPE